MQTPPNSKRDESAPKSRGLFASSVTLKLLESNFLILARAKQDPDQGRGQDNVVPVSWLGEAVGGVLFHLFPHMIDRLGAGI
jgi:hypothetical protein